MSRQITYILRLTEALESFEGNSHWTLSFRIFGKGDKLQRLRAGGDLSTRNAERALARIEESWPEDLEWPEDIPRSPAPEGAGVDRG